MIYAILIIVCLLLGFGAGKKYGAEAYAEVKREVTLIESDLAKFSSTMSADAKAEVARVLSRIKSLL